MADEIKDDNTPNTPKDEVSVIEILYGIRHGEVVITLRETFNGIEVTAILTIDETLAFITALVKTVNIIKKDIYIKQQTATRN